MWQLHFEVPFCNWIESQLELGMLVSAAIIIPIRQFLVQCVVCGPSNSFCCMDQDIMSSHSSFIWVCILYVNTHLCWVNSVFVESYLFPDPQLFVVMCACFVYDVSSMAHSDIFARQFKDKIYLFLIWPGFHLLYLEYLSGASLFYFFPWEEKKTG